MNIKNYSSLNTRVFIQWFKMLCIMLNHIQKNPTKAPITPLKLNVILLLNYFTKHLCTVNNKIGGKKGIMIYT